MLKDDKKETYHGLGVLYCQCDGELFEVGTREEDYRMNVYVCMNCKKFFDKFGNEMKVN